MIKDDSFLKLLFKPFLDRFNSPILSVFATSWIFVNFSVVLSIFSLDSLENRINQISNHYSIGWLENFYGYNSGFHSEYLQFANTLWILIFYNLICPILGTWFFVTIWPKLSIPFNNQVLEGKKQVKSAHMQKLSEVPISEVELNNIKTENQGLSDHITSLNKDRKDLQDIQKTDKEAHIKAIEDQDIAETNLGNKVVELDKLQVEHTKLNDQYEAANIAMKMTKENFDICKQQIKDLERSNKLCSEKTKKQEEQIYEYNIENDNLTKTKLELETINKNLTDENRNYTKQEISWTNTTKSLEAIIQLELISKSYLLKEDDKADMLFQFLSDGRTKSTLRHAQSWKLQGRILTIDWGDSSLSFYKYNLQDKSLHLCHANSLELMGHQKLIPQNESVILNDLYERLDELIVSEFPNAEYILSKGSHKQLFKFDNSSVLFSNKMVYKWDLKNMILTIDDIAQLKYNLNSKSFMGNDLTEEELPQFIFRKILNTEELEKDVTQ